MKALNPSTGNLEEVYVRALDGMPVGTIVDYDGQASDIPTGWTTYGTGQIKKTSETRPLGATVVNAYDNSQINAYSTQYIDNINTYSTTETNTGKKWIDGKDIYRKVISVNNVSVGSSSPINHSISNFGELVSITGVFYDGNNARQYPTVQSTGESLNMVVTSTQITFLGNVNWSASSTRTHKFILEYTKSS